MTAPDERVRALYGLPLDDFTRARNELAAELRADGEREAATAVKALRKPSAAAWAVNRLVRAEPDLVEALLGAGGELRQAHRQAASGRGAEQLRAAAESERAAVEALMARAHDALGRVPSAALAEAMRNSLHAAASDDEAREQVRTGTLTTERRPVGLGPVPGAAAAGRGRRRAPAGGGRAPVAEAERERRAAEHARELEAATAAEAALAREVASAERSLERAEGLLARAREAVDAAGERTREARRRLREAQAELARVERRRAQLERDVG